MANLPLLSCLLLTLCTLSLSADQVFISIDCGSSTPTYKDKHGIVWTGDDKYVKTGESFTVQQANDNSHVYQTLRVFTNKTKNCYTIDSVRPGRVLVRATFYYGNYDGKNTPPSFDLMFDGYYWASVNNSGNTPSTFEVIYVSTRGSISVCVAQTTPGLFPYISALEVRGLELDMYKAMDFNARLFTRRRVAFGQNATIRFPDDPYDRLWYESLFPQTGTMNVSSDAVFSSGVSIGDKPPPAVLKNAITSSTPDSGINNIYMGFPSFNYSVYINMYFSEVTKLTPKQTRSFYVSKDNKPFSLPFSPPYGNCTELYASNITVSSDTTFSLVPTNDSTLPPLINAMEVYLLEEAVYNFTNDKDLQGLASLQERFCSLEDWTGDPCLPSHYAWEWVKCNYNYVSPRVTTLLLGGYGLSGLLPDFSSMDALETINLSNNSLQGNIPEFLGKLPNLQILNLENNLFNGTIPVSLSTKEGLILRVSGNPDLCNSTTPCSKLAEAPKANSSARRKKKILEVLFAAIIPSIIVLQLS